MSHDERVPLYVRLPRTQMAALDELVESTGRRKQQLVSDLLSDRLVVGHAEPAAGLPDFSPGPPADAEVLTLEEAGALLRSPTETVAAAAEAGELPGRRLGGEWRFGRAALLAWLNGGD